MSVVEATQSAVACYDSPNQESKAVFSFLFFFFKRIMGPQRDQLLICGPCNVIRKKDLCSFKLNVWR